MPDLQARAAASSPASGTLKVAELSTASQTAWTVGGRAGEWRPKNRHRQPASIMIQGIFYHDPW
jgi:hypothetical protein